MKVQEYHASQEGSRFRMTSFYFYGRRQCHKLVLRFDRRTVTLSQRQGRYGSWDELKTWTLTQ